MSENLCGLQLQTCFVHSRDVDRWCSLVEYGQCALVSNFHSNAPMRQCLIARSSPERLWNETVAQRARCVRCMGGEVQSVGASVGRGRVCCRCKDPMTKWGRTTANTCAVAATRALPRIDSARIRTEAQRTCHNMGIRQSLRNKLCSHMLCEPVAA
jgi:hypothetical protein